MTARETTHLETMGLNDLEPVLDSLGGELRRLDAMKLLTAEEREALSSFFAETQGLLADLKCNGRHSYRQCGKQHAQHMELIARMKVIWEDLAFAATRAGIASLSPTCTMVPSRNGSWG